jgi:hypothetical protein
MSATQLTAVRITSSGSVWGDRGRVRALSFIGGASAGTIVLKDGGSSGTTIATIDTPVGTGTFGYIKLNGLGLKFNTNIYCTLTNTAAVTFFLG